MSAITDSPEGFDFKTVKIYGHDLYNVGLIEVGLTVGYCDRNAVEIRYISHDKTHCLVRRVGAILTTGAITPCNPEKEEYVEVRNLWAIINIALESDVRKHCRFIKQSKINFEDECGE